MCEYLTFFFLSFFLFPFRFVFSHGLSSVFSLSDGLDRRDGLRGFRFVERRRWRWRWQRWWAEVHLPSTEDPKKATKGPQKTDSKAQRRGLASLRATPVLFCLSVCLSVVLSDCASTVAHSRSGDCTDPISLLHRHSHSHSLTHSRSLRERERGLSSSSVGLSVTPPHRQLHPVGLQRTRLSQWSIAPNTSLVPPPLCLCLSRERERESPELTAVVLCRVLLTYFFITRLTLSLCWVPDDLIIIAVLVLCSHHPVSLPSPVGIWSVLVTYVSVRLIDQSAGAWSDRAHGHHPASLPLSRVASKSTSVRTAHPSISRFRGIAPGEDEGTWSSIYITCYHLSVYLSIYLSIMALVLFSLPV